MASACFADAAFALDVNKTVTVQASPDAVWKVIGDFCGIASWHPAVEKCELSKRDGSAFRTLTLKGGGTILEKETARSDKSKFYSYDIVESPLPVSNYKATLSVVPQDTGSAVLWISHFDAKGADDEKAKAAIARHLRCRACRDRGQGEVEWRRAIPPAYKAGRSRLKTSLARRARFPIALRTAMD